MNTKPHAVAVRGAETHYLRGSKDIRLRKQIDEAIMDMATVFTAEYAPLIEAAELVAQELESLTPARLNWHLATGELARNLRAELARVKGKQ